MAKYPTLSFSTPEFQDGDSPLDYYLKNRSPCFGVEFVLVAQSYEELYDELYDEYSDISKKLPRSKSELYDICEQVWLGEDDDWLKEAYRCGNYWILFLADGNIVAEKGIKKRR